MNFEQLQGWAKQRYPQTKPQRLRCCLAAGCLSAGSAQVKESLDVAVESAGLTDRVEVRPVGCLRACGHAPLVAVDPGETLYQRVTPATAIGIVAQLSGEKTDIEIPPQLDRQHPFFTRQLPLVLENTGNINPESLENYVMVGGYASLAHVLLEMTPEEIVATVTQSGLRGRGGAGYPTGLKWATVAKMPGQQKYVIANADEGDPGAFMDRSVMESDPHRVLEGIAIAGYAVGATQGYIYIRAEYPLAIQRLQTAIQQAKQIGVLGTQIFDSPFDFRIDLRVGAGAFVCGEETALIASVDGERGIPRPRPPYPAESGLWGQPTLINNVETLANIPTIIRKGADWFASIGTEKSKGTKVFSLTGKIQNTGLIEVPMGMSLREIVEDIGGGICKGGEVKAVQTGGPAGGCIPVEALATPVDYESLAQLGSIMGSGGMVVMDTDTSMVDVAKFYMDFCQDESCGKCVPCRVGTVQLSEMLRQILAGEATEADLDRLRHLCDMVKRTSLCGLGQAAPNPILSTLAYFEEEYLGLVKAE